MEIEDKNQDELLPTLIGKKIVSITREKNTGESFPQGANSVCIELESGEKLTFDGWGYDAWGVATYLEAGKIT